MHKLSRSKAKDIVFYCALLAWPIIQFSVMYIAVNVNSFALAFQKYEVAPDGTSTTNIVGTFENFANVFKWIFGGNPQWTNNANELITPPFWTLMGNSVLSWLIVSGTSIPIGLLFSYYIYKKHVGNRLFRVMLFLPSILSAMVMCGMFNWLDNAIAGNEIQWLNDPNRQYLVIMLFNIWIGFGVSVLMFTNQMSSVDPGMVDAGRIDGCSAWQEFWHILLPHTYSTVSVFIVTSVAGLFLNQYNMFAFFGSGQVLNYKITTFGYWFFGNVWDKASHETPPAMLFPMAAIGLVLTFIIVPLTLGTRWLLRKVGPREE